MELQTFIGLFAELFDDTDAAIFNGDTRFKELDEWSSLMALSIIAMVDEEYDVTLKGDDIAGATTVQDLFEAVNKKLG